MNTVQSRLKTDPSTKTVIKITKNTFWPVFAVSFMGCLIILYIRAWDINSAADLMNSEDGPIFLKQARANALASLIIPYAGYHHLIIRIVAAVSSLFPTESQPLVFLAGNLVIYSIAIALIIATLQSMKVRPVLAVCVVLLLFAKPAYNDLFLSLTNTQWMTGTAFIIYALGYRKQNTSNINILLAILFGLSGPFCILLLPVLALKHYVFKDKTNITLFYTLIYVTLLQIASLIMMPRSQNPDFNLMGGIRLLPETLEALGTGFLFGSRNIIYTGLIMVITIWALMKNRMKERRWRTPQIRTVFYLLTVAVLLLMISVAHFIVQPEIDFNILIEAAKYNSRYLFIPQCLFLVSTFIIVRKNTYISVLLVICYSVVSVMNFTFLPWRDIHYASMVNFSKYRKVNAFFNPMTEYFYPVTDISKSSFWMLTLENKNYKELPPERAMNILPEDFKSDDAALNIENNILHVSFDILSVDQPATVKLKKPVQCSDTADIGIFFNQTETSPVRVNIGLSSGEQEKPAETFFYEHAKNNVTVNTADENNIYAALPFNEKNTYLSIHFENNPPSLNPVPKTVTVSLKNMVIYCLPPM